MNLGPAVQPGRSLDPLVALATNLHSMPGVFGVLLGSGVSRAAGIPTGWGIITSLVRRAAVALAPDDPEAAARAEGDPEAWWAEYGDGTPIGYSNLLEQIGPSTASRQAMLAPFFESSSSDSGTPITPTKAHRAIARLVNKGYIKVIVTTNFDRLMEKALEELDITPQVISQEAQIEGMTPLAHARVSIIKVHGDYKELGIRNTLAELSDYPASLVELLRTVIGEYGLIACGWSADWDIALVNCFRSTDSRRYPMFWDSRSGRSETANQILELRRGAVVHAESADDLFYKLEQRVIALDKLAEPELTSAMRIARLKYYLPRPEHRIDLVDLIDDSTRSVIERVESMPFEIPTITPLDFDNYLVDLTSAAIPLLEVAATSVNYDESLITRDVFIRAIKRLANLGSPPFGSPYQEVLSRARRYPALLLLRTVGSIAIARGREDFYLQLATSPRLRDEYMQTDEPPASLLHDFRVLDPDSVRTLPRWNGQTWTSPISHLIRDDLGQLIAKFLDNPEDVGSNQDEYEFRIGLLQTRQVDPECVYKAGPGEFLGARRLGFSRAIEDRFASFSRMIGQETNQARRWRDVLRANNSDDLTVALQDYKAILERLKGH